MGRKIVWASLTLTPVVLLVRYAFGVEGTAVFALAGMLAVRRQPSAWAERVLSATVALVVVVAVAVARVYLLAHFASDVLASLCLGTASAVVIVAATDVGRRPGRLGGARGPSTSRASVGAGTAPPASGRDGRDLPDRRTPAT